MSPHIGRNLSHREVVTPSPTGMSICATGGGVPILRNDLQLRRPFPTGATSFHPPPCVVYISLRIYRGRFITGRAHTDPELGRFGTPSQFHALLAALRLKTEIRRAGVSARYADLVLIVRLDWARRRALDRAAIACFALLYTPSMGIFARSSRSARVATGLACNGRGSMPLTASTHPVPNLNRQATTDKTPSADR